MPKQLPPINELSLCKTCYGCNLLESPRFSGVVKCDNYMRGYPEYYRRMNGEYGASIDAERAKKEFRKQESQTERNRIIDKYWKGD